MQTATDCGKYFLHPPAVDTTVGHGNAGEGPQGLTAVCAQPKQIKDFSGEWVLVQVLSCHEKRAASLFLRDGVPCYLPLYHLKPCDRPAKSREIDVPLFSGYVFICGDEHRSWYDIVRQHTSGGKRIVCKTEDIRDQSKFVRQMSEIQESLAEDRIRPYRLPVKGDRCIVIAGSFLGAIGHVSKTSDSRLCEFVTPMFGRLTAIMIATHKLEIIDD